MEQIYAMVKNVKDANYKQLPADVVEVTKKLILDTLAVSFCGSAEAGVKDIIDIFKGWGGREESTIWVYGGKLPCISAAQINATMVHASDYDDTHDPSPVHTGVVAVPTALAVAEMAKDVDGKELITAIALAVDFTIRLCMACNISMFESGWHYTTLHGNFNAAIVSGKLLGFDEETFVNACGLAYHQAGGNIQCVHDGTLAKRFGPGFAVRNGIMSALMAQKGITGAKGVLQGRHGLFNVYHRGEYNPELLTADLGKRYNVIDISFKPYPCVRNAHPPIDAAMAIVKEYNVKAEEIENIEVWVSNDAMSLCEPLETKQNPRNTVDAQFSIPWAVAVAVARNKVGLDSVTGDAIKDETILALSHKVRPKIDNSLNRRGVTPAIVKIGTKDGRYYSKRVEDPYGSPRNPMGMDVLIEKFRDCGLHAARPVKKNKMKELIQLVSNLETVSDVTRLTSLMDWSS